MAIHKIHYLRGNSDDFPALYEKIEKWLKKAKVAQYQLNSTVHYVPEQQRWHILITIMYHGGAVSPIARPTLIPKR